MLSCIDTQVVSRNYISRLGWDNATTESWLQLPHSCQRESADGLLALSKVRCVSLFQEWHSCTDVFVCRIVRHSIKLRELKLTELHPVCCRVTSANTLTSVRMSCCRSTVFPRLKVAPFYMNIQVRKTGCDLLSRSLYNRQSDVQLHTYYMRRITFRYLPI